MRFRSVRRHGRPHHPSARVFWVLGVVAVGALGLIADPGQAGAATARAAYPDHASAIGWTDARCNGCHDTDRTFSHPVNVSPSMPVPAGFPLERGRLTCTTCHDSSDSSLHADARRGGGSLLRSGLEGAAFCSQCHEPGISSLSAAHAMTVGRAHLRWPNERPDRHVSSFASGLDEESSSCLECHDGSLATDAGSKSPGGFFASASMMGQDHPIGVSYRVSSRDFSFGTGRMVHPSALDGRIRLFEGTVGCGSCHSVYSEEPGHLVMSNQGSALCLSCHEDG